MAKTKLAQLIGDVLQKKHLSISDEEQLRQLLQNRHSPQDLKAFIQLHQAVMSGVVTQESRLGYDQPTAPEPQKSRYDRRWQTA